ncbi:MAG: hypothetical protein P8H58_05790, partial [Luminiphilus sp.]|nr:hypothetical protein [Luminiphilus sp.]
MGNIRRFSVIAACVFSFMGSQVSADHHKAVKPAAAPLNVVALSLPDIVHSLESHRFSSQDLTRAYLNRIDALNRSGPTLNAVISVNSSAMT